MALTGKDLEKISKLLNKQTDELEKRIEEKLASKADKKDVYELKDLVIGIRNELDTEYEFRYKLLENTVSRVDRIQKHLNLD